MKKVLSYLVYTVLAIALLIALIGLLTATLELGFNCNFSHFNKILFACLGFDVMLLTITAFPLLILEIKDL